MNTAPPLKQGSPEWLQYRRSGLGCSDAAAVMNVSPWMTALDLWRRKTGLEPEQQTNAAMRRGTELEPVARAMYEVETGHLVEPALVVHPEHDWLRASLDGITIDGALPIEIKCPGRSAHSEALEGHVPDYYWPQCQHILLVTGAPRLDYVSFDGAGIVIVEVAADFAYQRELFETEREFWACVMNRTPPRQPVYQGRIELDDTETLTLAGDYLRLVLEAERLKRAQESLKAKLLGLCSAAVNVIGSVTISRQRGRVTLDQKALESAGIDLEPFRRRGDDYWKVEAGDRH